MLYFIYHLNARSSRMITSSVQQVFQVERVTHFHHSKKTTKNIKINKKNQNKTKFKKFNIQKVHTNGRWKLENSQDRDCCLPSEFYIDKYVIVTIL